MTSSTAATAEVKFTKIAAGNYRVDGTGFEVIGNDYGPRATRWCVYRDGEIIGHEPTLQFCGYRIEHLLEDQQAPAATIEIKASLFTPNIDAADSEAYGIDTMTDGRAIMYLTPTDQRRWNAVAAGDTGETIAVVDQASGLTLWVRRDDCGSGCYCAAKVVGVGS